MATVYVHRRFDVIDTLNNVFYVGITKHDMNKKYLCYRPFGKNRNKDWKNLVYNELNGKYHVEILFTQITIEEAYEKEKELIKKYGRKDLGLGFLLNKSDGGKGILNMIFTEEQIKVKREAAKECNNREGAREKMSKKLKEITSSLEKRKQMSESAFICNNRKEVKEKISSALKKLHSDEKFKLKHRLATKYALNKKEVRENISKAQKIAQNRKETKDKIKKSFKKYLDDDNFIKYRNEKIKIGWDERLKKNINLGEFVCNYNKCNKSFIKKRSFQVFCSYNCGKNHSRQKKKYAI